MTGHFALSLGAGEAVGFFSEASGLSDEAAWSNVTLRRGVDAQAQLWRWRQAIIDGAIATSRRDARIDVLDSEGAVLASYELVRAWPLKYSSPGMNAGGNEVLVEEIELAHEGITRDR